MWRLIQIFAYFSMNYYIFFHILMKCCRNLEKKYPHFALFCIEESECPVYLFDSCIKNELSLDAATGFSYSQIVLIIPPITPHRTIFGFTGYNVHYQWIGHILLTLKYYVDKTRDRPLDLKALKRNIHKMKNIE